MDVQINGITYAPKCDVKKPDDSSMNSAIALITETLYHGEKHKALSRMWNILDHLSPEICDLAERDLKAAYDTTHD